MCSALTCTTYLGPHKIVITHIAFLKVGTVPISFFALLLCAVFKWLLLGKNQPGSRKASDWFCVRFWFVDTLFLGDLAEIGLALLDSAVGLPGYLRLLGAQVGSRCFLGQPFFVRASIDLVHIGDDVMSGSSLTCDPADRHAESGMVHLRPIRIGSKVRVGCVSGCVSVCVGCVCQMCVGCLSGMSDVNV